MKTTLMADSQNPTDALGGGGLAVVFLVLLLGGLQSRDLLAGPAPGQSRPMRVTIAEGSARAFATKTVLPVFPAESMKRGIHGVAVAVVVFGVDGVVRDVQIQEAPDEACGEAVRAAARGWLFKTVHGPNKEPAVVTTKLTFYFEIASDGRGTVSDPTPARDVNAEPSGTRYHGLIGRDTLDKLRAEGGLLLLDIRDRAQSRNEPVRGAVAMPVEEIEARSRELASAKSIVVVCYSEIEKVCDFAARTVVRSTKSARVFVTLVGPAR